MLGSNVREDTRLSTSLGKWIKYFSIMGRAACALPCIKGGIYLDRHLSPSTNNTTLLGGIAFTRDPRYHLWSHCSLCSWDCAARTHNRFRRICIPRWHSSSSCSNSGTPCSSP